MDAADIGAVVAGAVSLIGAVAGLVTAIKARRTASVAHSIVRSHVGNPGAHAVNVLASGVETNKAPLKSQGRVIPADDGGAAL